VFNDKFVLGSSAGNEEAALLSKEREEREAREKVSE
jgi:hypothetical protein